MYLQKTMTPYEQLVMETQEVFYRYQSAYQAGGSPYEMSDKKPLPYDEQIAQFAKMVQDADCILVGAASGLSAAGGGDFYYEDNASFRKYFGKFADKYHLKGAFSGTFRRWESPEEKWAYLSTFLHTTQTAPIRKPYLDLRDILEGRDYFVLTTNQDTQAVKAFPEDKVAEIQGDHRYFQCSRCCTDYLWDAVKPVEEMVAAQGDGTSIPTELIPRCPNCGAEAFPWVRGYGNLLEGKKYHEEYRKVSDWLEAHKDEKILFLELGVGRMTPMFIQEPFWYLCATWQQTSYVSVNLQTQFLPKVIENRGLSMKADIADVLRDVRATLAGERVVGQTRPTVEDRRAEYLARVRAAVEDADLVLIGASNGIDMAEGLNIFKGDGHFAKAYGDLARATGARSILEGLALAGGDVSRLWAWAARFAVTEWLDYEPGAVMKPLRELVGDKDCFVLTCNMDSRFERAGFDPARILETEGSVSQMVCSKRCTGKRWSSAKIARQLDASIIDGKVDPTQIPTCPHCGAPLVPAIDEGRLRHPDADVDEKLDTLDDLVEEANKIVVLELGVGLRNGDIKRMLLERVSGEKNLTYVIFNYSQLVTPRGIEDKCVGIDGDMGKAFAQMMANEPTR